MLVFGAGRWSWALVWAVVRKGQGRGLGRPREIAEHNQRHSRLAGGGQNAGGQGWGVSRKPRHPELEVSGKSTAWFEGQDGGRREGRSC